MAGRKEPGAASLKSVKHELGSVAGHVAQWSPFPELDAVARRRGQPQCYGSASQSADGGVAVHTIAVLSQHRPPPVIGPGQLQTYTEFKVTRMAARVALPM